MSFQNFGDSFQGQQPSDESGAPGSAGAQPQQPPMGQPMEGQQTQFQGAPAGAPGAPGSAQSTGDAKTTLWMGELEPWIDENFVRSVWFGMGYQVNVKMIRDKFSGYVTPHLFSTYRKRKALILGQK